MSLTSYAGIFIYSSYVGLTERRERKRAKRSIIQPKEVSVDEDKAENPICKKKTSKKDKQSKIPAAFALMHGFTATNVGKNRLTVRFVPLVLLLGLMAFCQLKPGPTAGVFGKGKASTKKEVLKQKAATRKGTANTSESTRLLY